MIAAQAARAHGIVTRKRLRAAGITDKEIRIRLARGSLIQVHPGVYRVGHAAPSVHATYLAAVLACGEGALLAGDAAAWLAGLVRGIAPPPFVLTRTERRIRGIRTRRCRNLPKGITFHSVPSLTVPQILVDLAATLSLDALARACHEAGVRHKTTPRQVRKALRPNAKGAAKLLAVMEGRAPVTLSALERRFLKRLDEASLPRPDQINRVVDSHRIDCRWREAKLTVELDSFTYHNSRHAFEQDRRREREAYARGDQHRRYTYADVFEDPTALLRELGALLTPR